MREWLVGGAVIESSVLSPGSGAGTAGVGGAGGNPAGLLLVRNRRAGGSEDWTPPGGVIDPGETVLGGLGREVQEETGLRVRRWHGPLYRIEAVAPGLRWHLRVEVHRALEVAGELRTGDDPDGIVCDADVVPLDRCPARMVAAHPWVGEPLMEWLSDRWEVPRTFHYVVEGDDPRSLQVRRVSGDASAENPGV